MQATKKYVKMHAAFKRAVERGDLAAAALPERARAAGARRAAGWGVRSGAEAEL